MESFHSDAESNAGPDLNRFHLLKEVAFSVLFVFLIHLSRSTLDRDVMALYGRGKGTLQSISETSGGLNFAVDKWRYKKTGDDYNDDIYLCVTVCFVDAD